ncbi:hypothetical protein AAG747_21440 [Rapidithrix thailandica]|uniref:SH3 domain-containing protein n=1 Tax=Rapidithrix thailandica TaxID=413964 RepID=A0AAW9SDF0_9BACT
MKQLMTLLLTLLSLNIFAEKIDGPANVRKEPNGVKIISLYDNVVVECTEIKEGWYTIGITVQLTKEQYERSKAKDVMPAGSKLYSPKNELLGETLVDLSLDILSSGGPKDNKWYNATVIGHTYKSNIRLESIPEIALKSILINEKKNLTESEFDKYLKSFGFERSEFLGRFDDKYVEYMIYENWIDDPSPMDRIRLIFKNSQLIAIVHTRDLGVNYVQPINLISGRKITIFKEMDSLEKEKFIKMNREVYTGVD